MPLPVVRGIVESYFICLCGPEQIPRGGAVGP